MFKKVPICFLLMAVLAHALPHPTISKESLRNKVTPSMTLVFQSLHDAATIEASENVRDGTHVTKPELDMGTEITKDGSQMRSQAKQNGDWSVTDGIFGDTESGRMPRIVMMPIVAI